MEYFETVILRQLPSGYQQTQSGSRSRASTTKKHSTINDAFEQIEAGCIDAICETGEFELIDHLEFEATSARETRAAAERGVRTLSLEVRVQEHENAVLLVERDGYHSWEKPTRTSAQVTPGTRVGHDEPNFVNVAAFEVSFSPSPRSNRAARGIVSDFIKDQVIGYVKVRVLKYVTQKAVGWTMAYLEKDIINPLVLMNGDQSSKWERCDRLEQVDANLSTRPRVLLLLHGTFSSTEGSYVDLCAHGFFTQARTRYDVIIGWDHKTLAQTPEENATELQNALLSADWIRNADIDCIGYSRGGLVVRFLTEVLNPSAPESNRLQIRKAIFVGCTNGGTLLASPNRWGDLLDTYTNAIVAGAQVSSLVLGPAPTLIARFFKGLSAFAKGFVSEAIDGKSVPGIAAMEVHSTLLKRLNQENQNRPRPGHIAYYAVTSNYDLNIREAMSSEKNGLMKLALINSPVDQLIGEENDLVVHTRSMTTFAHENDTYLNGEYAFQTNPHVFHTIYFTHPETVKHLALWLDIPVQDTDPLPTRSIREGSSFDSQEASTLVKSFIRLAGSTDEAMPTPKLHPKFSPPKISLDVVWGNIIEENVSCYAVGHYDGVLPVRAERVLDEAISGKYDRGKIKKISEADLVLTKLTRRGQIRSDLGIVQLFPWGAGTPTHRTRQIAVCGMGAPGDFDESAARQLYRELFLVVNSLPGRNSLAMVLIGSGSDDLGPSETVGAMFAGLSEAIREVRDQEIALGGAPWKLFEVKLVEYKQPKALSIYKSVIDTYKQILTNQRASTNGTELPFTFQIAYDGDGKKGGKTTQEFRILHALAAMAACVDDTAEYQDHRETALNLLKQSSQDMRGFNTEELIQDLKSFNSTLDGESIDGALRRELMLEQWCRIIEEGQRNDFNDRVVPVRVTIRKKEDRFRMSLMSHNAAKPERLVEMSPDLVEEFNRRIRRIAQNNGIIDTRAAVAFSKSAIHKEFRRFFSDVGSPIVFDVDSDSARLHWEILVANLVELSGQFAQFRTVEHVALGRIVTRQLTTPFAKIRLGRPDRGIKRALVIGNPTGDLPGARSEAIAVAECLNRNGVEVTFLLDPEHTTVKRPAIADGPASRLEVMSELHSLNGHFDLVHYSGHGRFDEQEANEPSKSGWVFEEGHLLSARDFRQLNENVPHMVFANACLTGRISGSDAFKEAETSQDGVGYSASVAEEFIFLGVRDFIGTAWEIPDNGAERFASDFYRFLLGGNTVGEALLNARKPFKNNSHWAAYMHYGVPR